jgi:hypothetical protein
MENFQAHIKAESVELKPQAPIPCLTMTDSRESSDSTPFSQIILKQMQDITLPESPGELHQTPLAGPIRV